MQDDQFVGVAAPNSSRAEDALAAIAKTAKWETVAATIEQGAFRLSQQNAQCGVPDNPFAANLPGAKVVRQTLSRSLHPARAARTARGGGGVERWQTDRLDRVAKSVGCPRRTDARLSSGRRQRARRDCPDFGAGLAANTPAKCASGGGAPREAPDRPVSLRWTREEEFTWAYFRPAAVIESGGQSGCPGQNRPRGISSTSTPARTPWTRLTPSAKRTAISWRPNRRCAKVRIARWPPRPTISRARFSWMKSPLLRAPTRSNSGSRIWKMPVSASCWKKPPRNSTGAGA